MSLGECRSAQPLYWGFAAFAVVLIVALLLSRATLAQDRPITPWGTWTSPEGIIYSRENRAKVDAEGRRFTPSGVPFDEVIAIKVRKKVFRVKAGFFSAWPTPDMVGTINERPRDQNGFGLYFWMPSRRPLEVRSLLGPRTTQPREFGRPLPAPDEYPVLITALRIEAPDSYLSPSRMLGNQLRGHIGEMIEENGMLRYRSSWDSGQRFMHLPGTDPEFTLSCTPFEYKVPNPSCRGHVHFRSDDLAFEIRIPSFFVRDITKSMTAVRQIISISDN